MSRKPTRPTLTAETEQHLRCYQVRHNLSSLSDAIEQLVALCECEMGDPVVVEMFALCQHDTEIIKEGDIDED